MKWTRRFAAKQGLYDPGTNTILAASACREYQGKRSHEIVRQAIVLINLDHRGTRREANTGDGAGILMQMPHAFFTQACRAADISLPGPKEYGAGMVFLPQNPSERKNCEEAFERIVSEEGQRFLGWRTVPTDNASLGATAKAGEPFMRQAFIARSPELTDDTAFERKLMSFASGRRTPFVIEDREASFLRSQPLHGFI